MILAIDPSGNFNEGKGITGWVTLDEHTGKITDFGTIDASTSLSLTDHWKKHIELIDKTDWSNQELTVIIEDYLLYANKASTQINSRMETPKLIGVLQYHCAQKNIPMHFQTAVSVKRRWKNHLLAKKNFVTLKEYKKGADTYDVVYIQNRKVSNHVVDAVRHAVHYYSFNGRQHESDNIYSIRCE